MIAKLWAQQIEIGARMFGDVPLKLRAQVAKALVDKGLAELVPVELGGTMDS